MRWATQNMKARRCEKITLCESLISTGWYADNMWLFLSVQNKVRGHIGSLEKTRSGLWSMVCAILSLTVNPGLGKIRDTTRAKRDLVMSLTLCGLPLDLVSVDLAFEFEVHSLRLFAEHGAGLTMGNILRCYLDSIV